MATKIITDSTSYIEKSLIKKHDITIAPLSVNFEDKSFKETEISNEDFYNLIDTKGIPTSSQPTLGELLILIENLLKDGNDVIGVFLSSEFSGTFNSAKLVELELSEKYPNQKIAILDSESNSMQLGFMALEGARLSKQEVNFDDIVDAMNKIIKNSRFLFIPDNLDYLEKGGRIGKAGSLLGNAFKITPILTVENKTTEIYKTVRTKKRAIDVMIDKMLKDHKSSTIKEIAVHHINDLEEAKALKNRLQELIDVEIIISSIGPVIGTHVGPGALGIVYTTDKAIRD